MDDVKIVELYLKRDENAITYTAEKYGKRLQNLSFGIVGDRETAEECENDTYHDAWRSIPPHTPYDYLYAYLARITRHLSLDRCRERNTLKRKAYISELSMELEQCIPTPNDCEAVIEDMAFAAAINSFLAGLKAEKRNIFVRRYFFLDSVGDIARRYHISAGKVKTTLLRCRRELKEYLIKEGHEI